APAGGWSDSAGPAATARAVREATAEPHARAAILRLSYESVSRRARAPVTRPTQVLQPRRVVVTGMGAVSPNGIGLPRFAEAVRNGRSGVSRIDAFDPAPYATQIGGEVRDFD